MDDCSLSLVMKDACDDGRKALKILREHYAGKGKPRVTSLYTDYVIKAENGATALRNAD